MKNFYNRKLKKFFMVLVALTIFLIIPRIEAKASSSTDPQLGAVVRQLKVGEQIKAMDGRYGWWLISENGKLTWCNTEATSSWNEDSTGYPELLKVESQMNMYEAQVVYNYKKGQAVQVIEDSISGWCKVKTPEGYYGWVNTRLISYTSNGAAMANSDITAYFTAETTPLQQIKEVEVGEIIQALDSRTGWWLIAERGKLGWINAGNASYLNSNASTFPIMLKVNSKMPVNEAGVVYTYSNGEKITLAEGSVNGWHKVKTPNGYYAWVNAGQTYYNENDDLLASSLLSAYFSGKESSVQGNQTYERKLINESKFWISKIPYRSPSVYAWQSDVLNRNNPPQTMDCSDFVSAIYAKALGIRFPDYTGNQLNVGTGIPTVSAKQGNYSNLRVGDLIIFTWRGGDYKNGDHVAMYIGNGQVIHETGTNSRGGNVKISSLNDYWGNAYGYLRSNILGIRRVLQ